jgi:hypothetical protein
MRGVGSLGAGRDHKVVGPDHGSFVRYDIRNFWALGCGDADLSRVVVREIELTRQEQVPPVDAGVNATARRAASRRIVSAAASSASSVVFTEKPR